MDSLRLILSNSNYFAPSWVFASLNIMTGTWILYLPHIKNKFELNDAEIGIALFSLALGLLISIPFIPFVNQKFGVGRTTKIAILLFAISFNFPLLAPSYHALCSCLFLTGFLSGFTDVSMNALVSVIEKNDNQNFMSAAHGFFSLGGFIGAGVGSILITMIATPSLHMFLVSAFIIITNLLLSKYYEDINEISIAKNTNNNFFKNIRPLIGLSLVGFIIMLNEGAVEHWSNLFLFDVVKVTESQAGFGFIAFSFFMTLGRFLGDGFSKKIGTIKIIYYGCAIAFVAYFLIITSHFILSIIGFGLLGLGLSVIVPELFRLAGQTKGVPASVGISIVSGIGFAGFLLGPVLLGFISDMSNLVVSYQSLAVLVAVAFGVSFFHLRGSYGES